MAKAKIKTQEVVREYIAQGGVISKTARAMKISRRTVYDHLSKAGYYEYKLGGPGIIHFRRRMPKPEKQKPSEKWSKEPLSGE